MIRGEGSSSYPISNVVRVCMPMKDDPRELIINEEDHPNSSIHKAAWLGKSDVFLDNLANLHTMDLFWINEQRDTALHIAAKAGYIHIIHKLLALYTNFKNPKIAHAWLNSGLSKYTTNNSDHQVQVEGYDSRKNMDDLVGFVLLQNSEGNTMLHEAMICKNNNIGDSIFSAIEPYNYHGIRESSLLVTCYQLASEMINRQRKSVTYLAVYSGYKKALQKILDNSPINQIPQGISPLSLAILNQDKDMMDEILGKFPEWMHLTETDGIVPLHYAAHVGYYDGVTSLLERRKCCIFRRDNQGNLPIHIASARGYLEVVKCLVTNVLMLSSSNNNNGVWDSTEMLDYRQRNILHIAALNGKHEVVCYILQNGHLDHMLNQQDDLGNTPLHLAAFKCHPTTVHYLTWDPRVCLSIRNLINETPLDLLTSSLNENQGISFMIGGINALYQVQEGNSSVRQQLTWTALKSSGAKPSYERTIQRLEREGNDDSNVSNNKQYYSDRVNTLTVVSTLITMASLAALLVVPTAEGTTHNLYHAMFYVFITCTTISLFSSIIATITLFWARLGLTNLVIYSLKIVMPLLGIALVSLSLAFMAGIYTVISKLTLLANLFLIITVIYIMVVFFLYLLLFFPSSSTNIIIRYLSYYPFLFIASLVEPKTHT